jgi:4-amino-4-deoxy-L-arabinose transferase-like glycosyltransferase
MLLAVSKHLGGQNAMFCVVPLSAGLLILATYGLGRRLASGTVALTGAWLVATSPVVLAHTMTAMTDVPVAAAWAGAFYLLLGTNAGSAAGAGVLSSVATLIRPNLAPLAAALGLHYLLSMRNAEVRRRNAWLLLLFAIGAMPGPLAVAAINQHLFGSPFESGYGNLTDLFAWNRVPANLRNYLAWLVDAHTPVALCGLAALFLPLRRLWPWTKDRTIFIAIDLFVIILWITYCAWLVFDTWYFSRFLLASWPFMMLGIGAVAAAVFRMNRRVGSAVVCSVIALGIIQLRFASAHSVFDVGRGEHRNIAIAQLARRVTVPNSVTISLIHSGSVRYYGGRMTLNYAWLDGNWLDRAVEWLESHGVHTYAVLEDWEMREFRQRFAGARRLAVLDGPPLAIYADPGKLMIFDLSTPPSRSSQPIVVTGIDASWKAVPPASPPRLAFTGNR